MAIPININDLIRQRVVESSRIEYKRDWNPEAIIHSVVAFANDIDNLGGGYIIIGIEEKNGLPKIPIKGIEESSIDRIQKDLLNKCNFIEPRYVPVIEPAVVEGKNILVLWIPGGEERPYKCPKKIYTEKGGQKSEKVCFIRKASNTIQANIFEERDLIELSKSIPFDDRTNYHANVVDIRSSLLSEFLHNIDSDLYEGSLVRTGSCDRYETCSWP